MVDGLPVPTVARTIVDCTELGTDPAQLRRAMRQGRQSGELSPSQVVTLEALMHQR